MAKQKPDDQLEHTYSSYVRIRDVALKTCQRRWKIGRSGERGSEISVLVAWHEDGDVLLGKTYLNHQGIYLQAGKGKKLKITAQSIADVYYADDIELLANTPTQAESLLHSLEQASVGIRLHVNVDKTEYMCFNQRGNISTLKGGPLKFVDKFTYRGSNVSPPVKDITRDKRRHGQQL